MSNKKYRVGTIINTHGLRGDMKVYSHSDYPERFSEIKYIFFDNSDEKIYIERVKYHKSVPIIKLKGIDSIENAEKYKGSTIFVDNNNTKKLADDEYMVSDLIGITAKLDNDEVLGVVENVLPYSANDIYLIKSEDGKEFLIPAIKEFVPVIDIKEKIMIIKPIKGMIN